MNIIFVSNFFNHHQKPLSDNLSEKSGNKFKFIETTDIPKERKKLGYGYSKNPEYVIKNDGGADDKNKIFNIINSADVAIVGSTPEELVHGRIKNGGLTFRYSERPLRKGIEPKKYLPRFLRWHFRNPSSKPVYLLCASAFTSWDYKRFFMFKNKSYKWGYFTETQKYDLDELFSRKDKSKILWVGRLLPLKHPDDIILAAEKLKLLGYRFDMDIIGTGEMEETLKTMISKRNLDDCVHMLGVKTPQEVRIHMEEAGIYLFTSDRQEGWGAVLNESMNSGCAVVASHEIGSVPYLIENGKNGFVYTSCDSDMLFEKIKLLLENPDLQRKLGCEAYKTITELWNAEVASERFINLSQHILNGEKYPDLYESGPCSKAEILTENWFK